MSGSGSVFDSAVAGLSPVELGFPEKFTEFREIQAQIVDWCLYGDPDLGRRRFMIVGAPGGAGKTLAMQTVAKLSGVKTVISTMTKGLEDQVVGDGFDLVDIRGKQNYQCTHGGTCHDGEENGCPNLGSSSCEYQCAVNAAKRHHVNLTNHHYWMHARAFGKGLECEETGPVKLLIVDEAHEAERALAMFMGTWVGESELNRFAKDEVRTAKKAKGSVVNKDGEPVGGERFVKFRRKGETGSAGAGNAGVGAHINSSSNAHGWVGMEWISALVICQSKASDAMSEIVVKYKSPAQAYRENKDCRKLSKLVGSLDKILEHGGDGNWIWQETSNGVKFDCVWPAKYADRYLFSGVERVILISATARPYLAKLLGIPRSEYLFKEWPRVFPAANGPVVWVPTGKMGGGAGEKEREKGVNRLDEIWGLWGHLKGIVHTASYFRAEWVKYKAKCAKYLMLNRRGESADEVAEKFRGMKAPRALVSPSYGTGYDFADDACHWQHIIKVPYADRSDPVVAARMDSDPEWYTYDAVQKFCQECWRGTRHFKDYCMTIVTDDAVERLMKTGKKFAPGWFTVRKVEKVPCPPESLKKGWAETEVG